MQLGQEGIANYWDKENKSTSSKPDYLHYILKKKMIKDMGELKGKRVLDVGCGHGDLLLEFKKHGAIPYGIDISRDSIKEAKKKGLDVKYGDCRDIPFDDDQFDVVYSIGVVEHVEETDKAIYEHLRVCRQGGTAIIIVPNKISPYYILGYVYYIINRSFRYGLLATKGKSYTKKGLMDQFSFKLYYPDMVRALSFTPDISVFYGSALLKETTNHLYKELADKIEQSFFSKRFGHLLYAKVIK